MDIFVRLYSLHLHPYGTYIVLPFPGNLMRIGSNGHITPLLSFLFPVFLIFSCSPPESTQSSEWVWNQCPDTRFSLMRIRNILIKTHNPPLNPSLQNHLHSVVLLHAATATAHSGPLFCFSSSLTQGNVSLCLPLVSVIFDPLSLDFQTRCGWKMLLCALLYLLSEMENETYA